MSADHRLFPFSCTLGSLLHCFMLQPFIDRSNPCVLHVTLRSSTRPHVSCTMLKGTNARPLWTLTLFVADKAQCTAAKSHFQLARESSRRSLMAQITRILPNLPFSPQLVPASAPVALSPRGLQSPRGASLNSPRHFSSTQLDDLVRRELMMPATPVPVPAGDGSSTAQADNAIAAEAKSSSASGTS